MKNPTEMTTEEIKAERLEIGNDKTFNDATWDRIFSLESELKKRGELVATTYNFD